MSTYAIYFVVGLVVNAVKIQSPVFKKKTIGALEAYKELKPEIDNKISDRVYLGFAYGAGIIGGIIGAATISIPAMIVKSLYELYEVDDNDDNDDTQGAVKA